MTHSVGDYWGTVALYRYLTRINVRDMKSESISLHVSWNNIRKNDIGLTAAMHYDIFPRITRLHTVQLLSIHCKDKFGIIQYTNFVHTY